MRIHGIILVSIGLLAGCATVSQMTATGGSRADGIVKLSYEVGMFDKVAIDEAASLQTARARCATWGYADAEAFGGHTRQCQMFSGSLGCTRWFVTKEYQCTAARGSTPAPLYDLGLAAASPSALTPASGGPRRVRAKTPSGFCLDVPDGYVGTGSMNMPAVTSAMPRCTSLGSK